MVHLTIFTLTLLVLRIVQVLRRFSLLLVLLLVPLRLPLGRVPLRGLLEPPSVGSGSPHSSHLMDPPRVSCLPRRPHSSLVPACPLQPLVYKPNLSSPMIPTTMIFLLTISFSCIFLILTRLARPRPRALVTIFLSGPAKTLLTSSSIPLSACAPFQVSRQTWTAYAYLFLGLLSLFALGVLRYRGTSMPLKSWPCWSMDGIIPLSLILIRKTPPRILHPLLRLLMTSQYTSRRNSNTPPCSARSARVIFRSRSFVVRWALSRRFRLGELLQTARSSRLELMPSFPRMTTEEPLGRSLSRPRTRSLSLSRRTGRCILASRSRCGRRIF